jgi:REP element-mobilizing transposase RayT
MILHRNSQKRIYEEGGEYFVTCKTKDNYPFFKEQIFCKLWIEELSLCKKLKKFELFGFCLLPDHFHMMFRPGNHENLSRVMQFFKRHFSRSANWLGGHLPEGDIRECRLLNEKYKNLETIISLHDEKLNAMKKQIKNHLPKFQWQKSFHDHLIRGNQDFDNCLDYTIENFAKHNLPHDWRYTSLNYPEMLDPSW